MAGTARLTEVIEPCEKEQSTVIPDGEMKPVANATDDPAPDVASLHKLYEPMHFATPIAGGHLELVEESAMRISKIKGRIASVISITGLYRTGKSFLLNRLAGGNAGFALGSTIQSKTKGIWIWFRPHPKYEGEHLVLMDTEGLGDVDKGDSDYDNKIFALSTLLSTVLIYNAMGCINEDMITKLNFITEVTKKIKISSSGAGEDEVSKYFPNFVITIRDFSLDLEVDGKEISADEYLEDLLQIRADYSKEYNAPRQAITKYFKIRRCFTFDRPAPRRSLSKIDTLSDKDLLDDYLLDQKPFEEFIYEQRYVPPFAQNLVLDAKAFVSLAREYIQSIRDGAVPCVERAYAVVIKAQNEETVGLCVSIYTEHMEDKLRMPTKDEETFTNVHTEAETKAEDCFHKKIVNDIGNHYKNRLKRKTEKKRNRFDKENRRLSRTKCLAALESFDKDLQQKTEDCKYMGAEGLQLFDQDIGAVSERYRSMELGLMSEEALKQFIENKMGMRTAISISSKYLTKTDSKKPGHAVQLSMAEKLMGKIEAEYNRLELRRNVLSAHTSKDGLREKTLVKDKIKRMGEVRSKFFKQLEEGGINEDNLLIFESLIDETIRTEESYETLFKLREDVTERTGLPQCRTQ